MRYSLALLALAASTLANPMPGAVTSLISAGAAPAGCDVSHSGTFAITVQNVSSSNTKRSIEERQLSGTLELTLEGGVLKDQAGRTGYIASNYQYQFDKPPQAGAIYTGGFSLCSNNSLAHGGSAVWYQCKTGTFFNLYDRNWAKQCNAVYIQALISGGTATTAAGEQSEGQPTATTQVTEAPEGQPQATSHAVTEASEGQPQAVTQITDGQPQAPTAVPVSQLSDGQPQGPAPTAVSEASEGQPRITTGAVSEAPEGQPQATTGAVSEAPEGQPQATTGAVSEAPEGQPQATTGAVSEAPEGQPQATTGAVSEAPEGQPQATTGAVSEAPEGQPQATTAAPNATVASPSPSLFTGAAAPAKLYGQEVLGAAVGIMGAVALL